jgi:hypothetical protein
MKRWMNPDVTWITMTPVKKRPIRVYADAEGEKPARVRYSFEVGSMLYREVKSYRWLDPK